jgi:phosphoglycolate phosphatase-like HAD superfamily hydrolase
VKLLITDLDNTLYDWVTYFAHAFDAMTRALEPLVGVSRDQLLDEFKAVHQRYGNSEQPFAVLELPSVQAKFGTTNRAELKAAVNVALHAFNAERKKHLVLYPSVRDTLQAIQGRGVRVVGHTEAIAVNALHRLRYLNIEDLFSRLYALHGEALEHPDPDRGLSREAPVGFIHVVPREERKPNPRLLLDICDSEGVHPRDAWYIGDSLSRDISMAKGAGVVAVWAKYGTNYDRELWKTLVRITHWTDEDVKREEQLRHRAEQTAPDYTVGSFGDLLTLVDDDRMPRAASARRG